MNSNQSYCLGGRHYSQTVNKNIYDKLNPKTRKLVKLLKESVVFVDETNLKFLLSK